MTKQTSILPLLENIIQDHTSYKFPVSYINKELTSMFLEPMEFDYFRMMAYRKLKKEYGFAIAHIFLQVMEIKMELHKGDIYIIPQLQYQDRMETFLSSLENLYITKIEKNTSDGEMMSVMV